MTRVILPVFLAASIIAGLVVQTGVQAGAQSAQSATQGSDQFLDGIGETSLIARYVFNGNVEDSSRNQLHATMRGTGGAFVEDGQRRVLLLTGEGSHVQLPSTALAGEDAIAVVGWLYLPTRATGPVFDFGQSAATRLFAVVDAQGFRASAVVDGQVRGETPAKPVVENQWMHFAVVLDPASRVLTAYIDGVRAGQATNVNVTPAQSCPRRPRPTGCSSGARRTTSAPTLHGRLRDIRLYRIALGDEPVATIRRNALAAAQPAGPRPRRGSGDLDRQHPARITVRRAADQRSRRHR